MFLDYSDGGLRAPNIELMFVNVQDTNTFLDRKTIEKRASLGGILEDDS